MSLACGNVSSLRRLGRHRMLVGKEKKKFFSEKIEQEMFWNVRVLCLVLRSCVEKKTKQKKQVTKYNVDSSAVTVLAELDVQLPVSYEMIVCVLPFPPLPTRILVKCRLVSQ